MVRMRARMIHMRFVTPKLRLLKCDDFSESRPLILAGEPRGGEMWAWPLLAVRRCIPVVFVPTDEKEEADNGRSMSPTQPAGQRRFRTAATWELSCRSGP